MEKGKSGEGHKHGKRRWKMAELFADERCSERVRCKSRVQSDRSGPLVVRPSLFIDELNRYAHAHFLERSHKSSPNTPAHPGRYLFQ